MFTRILKNSAFVLISQGLLLATNLIIYVLIGRKYGPDELGQFAFVMAYIGLFTFLADYGLGLYLTREISRNLSFTPTLVSNAFYILFFSTPFTLGLVLASTLIVGIDQNLTAAILWGSIYLIVGGFLSIFRGTFHANERMELETFSVILERGLTFLFVLIVLYFDGGIVGFVLSFSIARLITLVYSFFLYKRYITTRLFTNVILSDLKKTFRATLPFTVNILTTTIYIQVDLVLLGLLVTDVDAGYYKAATSLVVPLAIIASSLNSGFFPRMSRAFVNSSNGVQMLINYSLRYLFLIGWPMFLLLTILAPKIIPFIYGDGFQESILALQIMAVIIPMRFINNTMGTGLTAINQQNIRATVIFGSAILNLILNLILITNYSYIGASISTVLTEIFITAALFFSMKRYLYSIDANDLFTRTIICGLTMAMVSYFMFDINLIINLIVSGIIYFILIVILNALPKNDLLSVGQKLRQFALDRKGGL